MSCVDVNELLAILSRFPALLAACHQRSFIVFILFDREIRTYLLQSLEVPIEVSLECCGTDNEIMYRVCKVA